MRSQGLVKLSTISYGSTDEPETDSRTARRSVPLSGGRDVIKRGRQALRREPGVAPAAAQAPRVVISRTHSSNSAIAAPPFVPSGAYLVNDRAREKTVMQKYLL